MIIRKSLTADLSRLAVDYADGGKLEGFTAELHG
jgi:hypothetical protein